MEEKKRAGRPRKQGESDVVPTMLRIPSALHEKIVAYAKEKGITVNATVVTFCEYLLGYQEEYRNVAKHQTCEKCKSESPEVDKKRELLQGLREMVE